MRILLTGAGGQLGRALAASLPPLGTVMALRRSELDVTDAEAVARSVAEAAPDLVVNAAAYTAVDKAESAREAAWAVNARAPGYLADAASSSGAAILHVSTDYVFAGDRDSPYREDDPTGPVNVYGASKVAGEAAVAAAGAPYLVVRTGWLYDAHSNNFLATILRRGAHRAELPVVADQVGGPTSVGALAAAVAALTCNAADDLAGAFARAEGLLHLSCGGAVSRDGFAQAIVDGVRDRGCPLAVRRIRPITSAETGAAAARPAYSVLDNGRAARTFGLRLPDWREALEPVLDAVAAARSGTGLSV